MELGEGRTLGVLDASCWQQRGTLGESIGELFQIHWPSWIPSSRTRVNNTSSRAHRANLVHQYLAFDPATGQPRMVMFATCRKLISSISAIPVDKNNPECVDTDSPLDHYFDALSYMLQSRPINMRGWSDPFERIQNTNRYRDYDPVFGY